MSGVMTLKRYPSQGGMTFGKIGARRMMAKNPYITDGLVAWWDGIRFLSANGWEDLIGSNTFQATSGTVAFADKGLVSYPGLVLSCPTLSQPLYDALNSSYLTIEYVSEKHDSTGSTGGDGFLILSSTTPAQNEVLSICSRKNTTSTATYDTGIWFRNINYDRIGTFSFTKRYWACSINDSNRTLFMSDGEGMMLNYTSTRALNSSAITGLSIGARMNQNWTEVYNGHLYAIRIYSRALTDAEIAHNYAVDRARFNLP